MLTLPIPAKIKAVVGLLGAVAIVLTGVAADNVLNLNDVTTYGAQLVEAIGTYVAIFRSPRNRATVDELHRDLAAQLADRYPSFRLRYEYVKDVSE